MSATRNGEYPNSYSIFVNENEERSSEMNDHLRKQEEFRDHNNTSASREMISLIV